MKYQKHQKSASVVMGLFMILIILDKIINDSISWKLLILSLLSYSYIMFPDFWKYVLPMHFRKYSTEIPEPNKALCYLVGWGWLFICIFAYTVQFLIKL